ncbi:hypothetical protein YB2330_004619 [Saitoella coloradoensis]
MTDTRDTTIRRRSKFGCRQCKAKKVKCDEAKPQCTRCTENSLSCDYSLPLYWGGRPVKIKKSSSPGHGADGDEEPDPWASGHRIPVPTGLPRAIYGSESVLDFSHLPVFAAANSAEGFGSSTYHAEPKVGLGGERRRMSAVKVDDGSPTRQRQRQRAQGNGKRKGEPVVKIEAASDGEDDSVTNAKHQAAPAYASQNHHQQRRSMHLHGQRHTHNKSMSNTDLGLHNPRPPHPSHTPHAPALNSNTNQAMDVDVDVDMDGDVPQHIHRLPFSHSPPPPSMSRYGHVHERSRSDSLMNAHSQMNTDMNIHMQMGFERGFDQVPMPLGLTAPIELDDREHEPYVYSQGGLLTPDISLTSQSSTFGRGRGQSTGEVGIRPSPLHAHGHTVQERVTNGTWAAPPTTHNHPNTHTMTGEPIAAFLTPPPGIDIIAFTRPPTPVRDSGYLASAPGSSRESVSAFMDQTGRQGRSHSDRDSQAQQMQTHDQSRGISAAQFREFEMEVERASHELKRERERSWSREEDERFGVARGLGFDFDAGGMGGLRQGQSSPFYSLRSAEGNVDGGGAGAGVTFTYGDLRGVAESRIVELPDDDQEEAQAEIHADPTSTETSGANGMRELRFEECGDDPLYRFESPPAYPDHAGTQLIATSESGSTPLIRVPFPPLPAVLHDNPELRTYFEHYMWETSTRLVPHHSERNPFFRLLGPLSLNSPPLLSVILATGAVHRARMLGLPEPTTQVTGLVNHSIQEIIQALADPRTARDDGVLAATIALSSHEVLHDAAGAGWRRHLRGARDLIMLRGGPREDHGELWRFLVKWLAYFDIQASLANPMNRMMWEGKYWVYEGHEKDPIGEYFLDPYMGFLGGVMPIMVRISEAARKKKECGGVISHELGFEVEAIKADLRGMKAKGPSLMPQLPGLKMDAKLKQELGACNDAFYFSGLIHLFRRVEGIPTNSPVVQGAVCNVVSSITRVPPGCNAEAALLLPCFTAGCEALDRHNREFVLERIRGMEKLGVDNIPLAKAVVERVQQKRDEGETAVDWDQVVQEMGIDLNLC